MALRDAFLPERDRRVFDAVRARQLPVIYTTGEPASPDPLLDESSFNYRMSAVTEASFDRFESSHAMRLSDLNAKYADVVGIDATVAYIRLLPDGVFLADMPSLADRPTLTPVN